MKQDYFDRVYEKTYRPLLRYAILHLSNPADAEDALQNVYVDFYRRIERYGHLDILAPKSFLLKMLKREIIKNYAERSVRKAYLIEDYDKDRTERTISFTFEDAVLDRAMVEQVFCTAKSLPPETYRVFVLYYGFEMSVADICTELQIGREAVKSRLFRARNELRKQLFPQAAQSPSKRGIHYE
ncbi:MAG: RNA polymerase sigma factor [Clostridia bacterium]|nr:RNA polymerase sigma factor [Clostridia bacterium]